jgi:hypothetical protein
LIGEECGTMTCNTNPKSSVPAEYGQLT